MSNVITVYKKIEEYAANPLGDMRVVDECPAGKFVRQGDVYVTAVKEYDSALYVPTENRQLAPGSSKGSRHTVSDSVSVFRLKEEAKVEKTNKGFVVLGPMIESKERFSIMHPEHADISLPPGRYCISYQVDPVTMKRVLD